MLELEKSLKMFGTDQNNRKCIKAVVNNRRPI
jgi:hypothetical protein